VSNPLTPQNGHTNGVTLGPYQTPPVVPAVPSRRDEDLLSIDGISNLIRRQRWLVLASMLVVVGLVGALCVIMTPTYEATAAVRVLSQKMDVPSLFEQVTNDREVATEVSVLQSRRLAEATIDSLGLRAVIKPARVPRSEMFSYFHVDPLADSATYMLTKRDSGGSGYVVTNSADKTLGVVQPGGQLNVPGITAVLRPGVAKTGPASIKIELQTREDAYELFDRHRKVERPVRDADVMTVEYRGKDPELTRDVPNVLAALFIIDKTSMQKVQARSTVKILREQLDSLSNELNTSEAALQAFREQHNVVSLPDEAQAEVQHAATIQAERADLDAEKRALTTLMRQVTLEAAHAKPEDPSPYRKLIAFPTLLKNPASTELLHSLSTIDDERTTLLTRRTPKDPDVMALTDREHQVEDQVRGIATTYLSGLTEQVASYDSTLGQYDHRMDVIPAVETQYARLSRTPHVLDTIFVALQTRLKEAQVAEAVDDPTLQLMDPATLPVDPVRPKPALYLAISVLLGLLVGLGLALARDSRDHTVHTRADVLAATGAPVLGLIPRISGDPISSRLRFSGELGNPALAGGGHGRRRMSHKQRLAALDAELNGTSSNGVGDLAAEPDARSAVAEAYSRLQTNLAFLRPRGENVLKTMVITSPLSGDGKTTSAVNLAVTLVTRGHRVLLIDADLRRGIINRVFGASRTPGLSDVIAGTTSLEAAVRGVSLGRGGELHYLPTGSLPAQPAALLDSHALADLLARLPSYYDRIIIDSPPINIVSDAALLSAHADGVLVIARSGVTATQALSFAMEQLRHVRAPVLGAVLNDVDFARDAAYDGNYRFQGYRDKYYTVNA
jgi:capsular exopolysaccharide synthesis family protein